MFNGAFFWRLMFAAIAVFFVFLALPPFLTVIGIPVSAALLQLVKLCIAAIAVFYVVKGSR